MHADFLRSERPEAAFTSPALHQRRQVRGVRLGGGVISHQQIEVEVVCLPANLPEYIEVDMADVEVETIIHLSDLKLPAGIELAELLKGASHDLGQSLRFTNRAKQG